MASLRCIACIIFIALLCLGAPGCTRSANDQFNQMLRSTVRPESMLSAGSTDAQVASVTP